MYLRPAVLIVDEIGYAQLNRQEAKLFFRLISQRYEHGSVVLTSNTYFSDWGELLSDYEKAPADVVQSKSHRLFDQKSRYFYTGIGCELISFAESCNLRDMFTFSEFPKPAETKKFSGIIVVRAIIMIKI